MLNDQASLQYMSAFREFYVVVLVDSKIDFKNQLTINDLDSHYENNLNGYTKLIMSYSAENIFNVEHIAFDTIIINQLHAHSFKFNNSAQDEPSYFHGALIEGKNHFYQLFTWTLSKNEDAYKKQMNEIVNSFNEI
jgi:hypothetical protein